MKKLHQNIFYYYKGMIDKDIEQQLEDNTTKALINVLENTSLGTQKKIIQNLTGIKIPTDTDKINYILQVSTIGKERIADISNRFLLAFSPVGKIEDYEVEYKRSSRPDAWIWSSDFVILFENKTRGELSKAQLKQHNKLLNGKTIIRSWMNDKL